MFASFAVCFADGHPLEDLYSYTSSSVDLHWCTLKRLFSLCNLLLVTSGVPSSCTHKHSHCLSMLMVVVTIFSDKQRQITLSDLPQQNAIAFLLIGEELHG